MIKKIFLILLALSTSVASEPVNGINLEIGKNNITNGNKQPDIFEASAKKKLRWKFNVGDVLEIKKKSFQEVKINNPEQSMSGFERPVNITRDLFYRVTLDTIGKDTVNGYLMESTFHTLINYKENKFNLFQEQESQESTFYIQPRGIFFVPPGTYMPNVRDIPVFPELEEPGSLEFPMEEGFSWSYPGIEIMQVADSFEYIPLNVKYEYRGTSHIKLGDKVKPIHKILYNVEFNHTFKKSASPVNPKQIFGYVTSRLLWDEKLGIPYMLTEDYDIVLIFNSGEIQEFKITSKSEYTKKIKKTIDEKEKIRNILAKKMAQESSGVNINVQTNSKGISIQIPDVLFDYNSSVLTKESQEILTKIGKILESYIGNNQILVRGHTDKMGKDDYNLKLSQSRAATVANYLYKNLNIPVDNISFEGVGSKFPISDNRSENGRKKNRRVEILILDK
jgi:outer membrane protein OmpA-like peptidoglycan-associated protein